MFMSCNVQTSKLTFVDVKSNDGVSIVEKNENPGNEDMTKQVLDAPSAKRKLQSCKGSKQAPLMSQSG